jgi:hypothetical protein
MNTAVCDTQFEDVKITEVKEDDSGWEIKRDDGWSFFINKPSPVVPVAGSVARFYGKGMGFPVRGLSIDGTMVYYRDEDAETVYRNEQMYGKDITEWLSRWDRGDLVWSIEMGGLGPGYEQAIQITVAEAVRIMLDEKFDAAKWPDADSWKKDSAKLESRMFATKKVSDLGLSGAQWGAAISLAAALYKRGPVSCLTDDKAKDRTIQVCAKFPG